MTIVTASTCYYILHGLALGNMGNPEEDLRPGGHCFRQAQTRRGPRSHWRSFSVAA